MKTLPDSVLKARDYANTCSDELQEAWGKISEIELPTIIDTENNPVSVVQTLPTFITFADGKYTFTPTNPAIHLGFFIIRGEITDT